MAYCDENSGIFVAACEMCGRPSPRTRFCSKWCEDLHEWQVWCYESREDKAAPQMRAASPY